MISLTETQQNQHHPNSEKGLLDLSNQIIDKKARLERTLAKKINVYEGKTLDGISKDDLAKYAKIMTESLKKINNKINSWVSLKNKYFN